MNTRRVSFIGRNALGRKGFLSPKRLVCILGLISTDFTLAKRTLTKYFPTPHVVCRVNGKSMMKGSFGDWLLLRPWPYMRQPTYVHGLINYLIEYDNKCTVPSVQCTCKLCVGLLHYMYIHSLFIRHKLKSR